MSVCRSCTVAKWLDGSRWNFACRSASALAHCVRWGPTSPPPKGHSPQFSAHICCGQMAAWIKMSLGMQLGLGAGDFVLRGDPAPPPKNGRSPPQFSTHIYCGQTAAWTKMPLYTDLGLGLRDIVKRGPTSPALKGHSPQFSANVRCGQTAG